MTPGELFEKAFVALRSADLLLQSGDLDGCCNRAYYAMFDAARAALVADGGVDQVLGIKTHSGLISFFSLRLVKTGRVPVELGKSFNKVEDLRLLADYRGDALELAQAQWAVEQAQFSSMDCRPFSTGNSASRVAPAPPISPTGSSQ